MNDLIYIKLRDLFASSIPGEWGSEGSVECGTPVLRSTNFQNDGSIDYANITYRTVPKDRLDKRRINVGTILIEKSGGSPIQPAGRVVYCNCDFNGTASNFIEILKARAEYCPQFLGYLLYYLYQTGKVLKYQQQTTGIINFKLNEYLEEAVIIPRSKIAQVKIVHILSTVDQAIKQTEALIAKQQRIKSGLMQDLLTRGIDEQGNLRSEKTHQFKDSPLGRIPVEWEVDSLDNLLAAKQYGISTGLVDAPIGIPVLRMNNLANGEVHLFNLKYSICEKAKKILLNDRDVLFNRTNSMEYVGRTGIYRQTSQPVSFASYLVRLVPNGLRLHPEYLNIWLNSPTNQIRVKQLATIGVQQANVNPTNLSSLLVAIPGTLKEQEAIIECISASKTHIHRAETSCSKLRVLKTALMQDLLTGRKQVTALLQEKEMVNA